MKGGLLIGAIAAAALAVAVEAQQPPKTLRDGVFTSDQALRGKSGFDGVCARCHGIPLTGSVEGWSPRTAATSSPSASTSSSCTGGPRAG